MKARGGSPVALSTSRLSLYSTMCGAGTPVTVIQNTLNNQSIRSLMTIDASVNTLQAFRSQLANTALNHALLRAASMR